MRLPKLRYSLRTFLIVIAIVACWFGYHLRIKSQRQELLAAIKAQGGEYQTYDYVADVHRYTNSIGLDFGLKDSYVGQRTQISQLRAWLGDAPVCYIFVSGSQPLADDERARLNNLFPEATITIGEENVSPKIKNMKMIFHSVEVEQIRARELQKNGSK